MPIRKRIWYKNIYYLFIYFSLFRDLILWLSFAQSLYYLFHSFNRSTRWIDVWWVMGAQNTKINYFLWIYIMRSDSMCSLYSVPNEISNNETKKKNSSTDSSRSIDQDKNEPFWLRFHCSVLWPLFRVLACKMKLNQA